MKKHKGHSPQDRIDELQSNIKKYEIMIKQGLNYTPWGTVLSCEIERDKMYIRSLEHMIKHEKENK